MIIAPDSDKLKILILDDDLIVRKILSKVLSENYEIQLLSNYNDFKEVIGNYHSHIIILDITLPDMNGIEICKELRKNEKYNDSIILILSSTIDAEVTDSIFAAGADDYIRKPFYPYEIKSKIMLLEKIIRTRLNLKTAYNKQLSYNDKLYRLDQIIRENLKIKDIDSRFIAAESLRDIVDFSFMELIKIENDKNVSILKKKYIENPVYITFEKICRYYNFSELVNMSYQELTLDHAKGDVHIIVLSLEINKVIYGYILIERDVPFMEEDRKLVSLYLDSICLINDRFGFEDIIEAKNKEFKSEISKIRKIQVSLLPDFNEIKDFDIATTYLPASELSGDFFDGFYVDESIYQLILCDISGHGLASAYIGNAVRTLFRKLSLPGMSPAQIAKSVNDAMIRDFKDVYYFGTAIILQIDFNEGKIVYLNAGHPPILYFDKDKNFIKHEHTGPLIGLFIDNEYSDIEIIMHDGDSLLLYTDGIIEAASDGHKDVGNMYGEERLIENFINAQEIFSKDIIHSIVGSFYEFTDYMDQEDDITIICIRKINI